MNLLILMNTSYEKYSGLSLKEAIEKDFDVSVKIRYGNDVSFTENQLVDAIESADFVLLLYGCGERVSKIYKLAQIMINMRFIDKSHLEIFIADNRWGACYDILKNSGWLEKKED